MIQIVPYDPAWPEQFEALRAELAAAFGPAALAIDHIGSTAVPGLSAKDVIDIQVTVAALGPELAAALSAAGWVVLEHTHDHVPAGEPEEPAEWEKLVAHQPPGRRRANAHVRVAGRRNQRFALLFRDFLRAHPDARDTIARIKLALARYHADDVEAYYDIKDPVYDLIWGAAQAWAAASQRRPQASSGRRTVASDMGQA